MAIVINNNQINGASGCTPSVFGSSPGRVSVVDICPLPLSIQLTCWGGGQSFRAIITRIGLNQQAGFQFLHTLRNYIYLYTFNERIGEMVISGITFADACGSTLRLSGVEAVMAYYNKLRATRQIAPVQVAIGSLAFNAFLLGVATEIDDPASGMGRFAFRLYYPPINSDSLNNILAAADAQTACQVLLNSTR